ncbi:MAG TPA: protein kinase [Chthoniobacterales bacterium]|nr:protein kinase [Chthoniobacterales bacterium]
MKSDKAIPLTAERWQQAKAIVAAALDEESSTARAALVAERCGSDEELLREVESLLEQTSGSLDKFENASLSLRRRPTTLAPGLRIGAYAIVRELGRGGMGAVYLAQRADGVFDKQVAIKVLKRGTDTDEILRRFNAERQILARLDHPNITRLIDAGTTGDGLPYVVMDYVVGKPITEYAREKQLSVTERLKLFRSVCSAVTYAHQNLIVHRDLKPTNIFVTETGEVRLLDFGIAKLLSDAEGSGIDLTITALRVMTPDYASPEQIKGELISTSSDVYSLGVCLYELLTGARPYKLTRKTSDELSRAICDQEPQRPSTAVTKADGKSRIEIRDSKILRGDLDNIVLKALRKDPSRRYPSVDQFSEDIRRHLEGLPVLARRDTPAYRASKFVQRHKVGVALATVFVLALVSGTIAIAREAHLARQRFKDVRELAHSVLFDYHDAIAALPGSTSVRQRLVKDALAYLNKLSRRAGNDTSLLRELAGAYEKVAMVQGGATVSSRGTALSASHLGDTKGARENLNKALAIRQRVSALEPNNSAVRQELAYCYERIGVLYVNNGPPDQAVENLRKAAPILESLLAADPANEDLQYNLVDNYEGMAKALGNPILPNLGDTQGALDYLARAQPIIEKLVADHPSNLAYQLYLAAHHNAYGWVLGSASGKLAEALEHAQKAVSLFQALSRADPGNTLYRSQLVQQLSATGRIMLNMGDKQGAVEVFEQGLSLCESLLLADPRDAYNRKSVALAHRNVAEALGGLGDHSGALSHFQKAQQMFAELVAEDPANADSQSKWAYVCLAMSQVQADTGDLKSASTSALQGIKIDETLLATSAANALARNTLAQLCEKLGDYQAKLGEEMTPSREEQTTYWQAAKEAYQKSLENYQEMKKEGTLKATDSGKPDEVARAIAKCDTALK